MQHQAPSFFSNNNMLFLGFEITSDQLEEAAVQSGVLDGTDDYISEEFHEKCEHVLPNPDEVAAKDLCNNLYFPEREIHCPTWAW